MLSLVEVCTLLLVVLPVWVFQQWLSVTMSPPICCTYSVDCFCMVWHLVELSIQHIHVCGAGGYIKHPVTCA